MNSKIEIVKEIIWNIFVYILYFIYFSAILLLFHLIFFTLIKLNWSMKTIFITAFAASTVRMIIKAAGMIKEKKKRSH